MQIALKVTGWRNNARTNKQTICRSKLYTNYFNFMRDKILTEGNTNVYT